MDISTDSFPFLFTLQPIFLAAQGLPVLVVLFLVLLFFSFIVSGAEVAFFSLKYKDLNMLKTKSDDNARRVVTLLEQPKVLMGSLLSANTFFNLGIIFISNFLIDELLQLKHEYIWMEFTIKAIAISALILLFCEILPKVWASHNNLFFALTASWLVDSVVYPVFRSAGQWLSGYSDGIEKRLTRYQTSSIKADELDYAIDLMSEDEATIEEKNILKGIQKFSNITVKQVMRSRLDVSGIEYDSDFTAVIKRIEELHYSRLPVYKTTLDEVAGILHTKDLLNHIDEPASFNWHQLMRTPFFVPEQKLIDDLLKEFQLKKIHFAVVVDEFGGTSGIVTMEDILEEIIGDIKDEFDEEETINKKIDEFNYLFEGKTMIHDVCKVMGIPPETFDRVRGESESLAGLVLEIAERLPKINDVAESGDFMFTVLEVSRNRIQKVKVTIKPPVEN